MRYFRPRKGPAEVLKLADTTLPNTLIRRVSIRREPAWAASHHPPLLAARGPASGTPCDLVSVYPSTQQNSPIIPTTPRHLEQCSLRLSTFSSTYNPHLQRTSVSEPPIKTPLLAELLRKRTGITDLREL